MNRIKIKIDETTFNSLLQGHFVTYTNDDIEIEIFLSLAHARDKNKELTN